MFGFGYLALLSVSSLWSLMCLVVASEAVRHLPSLVILRTGLRRASRAGGADFGIRQSQMFGID